LRESSLVRIVTSVLGRLEDGLLDLYVQSDQTYQAASSDNKSEVDEDTSYICLSHVTCLLNVNEPGAVTWKQVFWEE